MFLDGQTLRLCSFLLQSRPIDLHGRDGCQSQQQSQACPNPKNFYQLHQKTARISINKLTNYPLLVYQNAFIAFGRALSRFFKGMSGFPNFKRKKFGDSFTLGEQQEPSIARGRKKD